MALSLLGDLNDVRAGELLIGALTRKQHPASRVAIHIDRSPLHLADRLRPLLRDADPDLRFWAAVLLGRYLDVADLERDLIPMVDDPDPRVRKAAIESLGRIGDEAVGVGGCAVAERPGRLRARERRPRHRQAGSP